MKTIAFIDAGQFRPAIVNQRLHMPQGQRFDWSLFRNFMRQAASDEVFDTHYFDCVSDAPSAGREAFHQFLRNTLSFQLHFSELKDKRRTCGLCKGTYIEHEQKGVDVGIAVHMLKLAYSNAYEQALLCSGDGDFAPLVTYLRDSLGKRVIAVGWQNGVAPALRDASYKVVHLEDYQQAIIGTTPDMPCFAATDRPTQPACNHQPASGPAAPATTAVGAPVAAGNPLR